MPNSFSYAVIACWFCLLKLCQSKYVEVNSKGNDSNDCCMYGTCLCGSLFEAILNVENDTMINITSSVPLHNITRIGLKLETLNNITITGNRVTVNCNNTGIFICLKCSNVVIQGITWNQCGDPNHPYYAIAVSIGNAINISIIRCTFQNSKVCYTLVLSLLSGFAEIQDSRFLFNNIANVSKCVVNNMYNYGSLIINDAADTALQNIFVSIIKTLFYHNGYVGQRLINFDSLANAACVCLLNNRQVVKIYIEDLTVSTSFGLGSSFISNNISSLTVQFTNVTYYNNSNGGSLVNLISNGSSMSETFFIANSCSYLHNNNGSLLLMITASYGFISLHGLTVVGNQGMFNSEVVRKSSSGQGSSILLLSYCFNSSIINISFCNIQDNSGGKSIVYIENESIFTQSVASVASCNFTNNIGSALYISGSDVQFVGHVVFSKNFAARGSALYMDQGSQIAINKDSVIEFIGNTASQQGGAIFIELPFSCPHNGIVFTNLANFSTVSFINNSADTAGNAIYFDIPESCDNIGDSLIYKFNYSLIPEIFGPHIATSPYRINLCSTTCNDTSSSCRAPNRNMLGQSVGINAVACDYYGNVSETVLFYIECTNCNDTYRLSSNRIRVHQGSFDVQFRAVDANSDILDDTNVTLSLSSVLSSRYRQLTATVSVELSSCQSGYAFNPNFQECVCYDQSKDIIRCQKDYAEIKYGYWFGIALFPERTVSLCPVHYCEYESNALTSNGYYILPEEHNDQCSSHRTGVACSECQSGYTLAYDSPDCINRDNCSAGMTVLVVALTILYWVIVVALVFGLMQFKISLGYVYGMIYYYSVMDILLGSNLYISDGVFELVAILSSFAKLTPQFLGRLCFVQGLSGIDQLFIHYFHALFIFFLIGGIVIAAKYSFRIASIVRHCIIRVICLLILLSYTSLASTSLQLLRPLHFDDVNGAYVYSSPSITYFTGRHIPYGIIALLCGLFIVIGLPLLLLLEPFLKSKVNFIRIKPLLDQYQECYKDQYHWFAAYYLICRQVIIAIVYVSNFNNGLYYLQTACIIIVTIHVWIKPYKTEKLNVLDGIILLTIILVINLTSSTFSRSLTTTFVVIMAVFPLLCSCLIYSKNVFTFLKHTWNHKKINTNQDVMPK